MTENRTFALNSQKTQNGDTVVYWMSREQRVYDNWTLIAAQKKALEKHQKLVVVFCLVNSFLGAAQRQFGFMLRGLKEVAETLNLKNIPFYLLTGEPDDEIPRFLNSINASHLYTDFDPLKIKREWVNKINAQIDIPFFEVDSHNIVPCRKASIKQEWAAYTIRPKINKLLPEYLIEIPEIKFHSPNQFNDTKPDFSSIIQHIDNYHKYPREVDRIIPGEQSAHIVLNDFIQNKLEKYEKEKNDPTKLSVSDLSPFLHFGQISSQRIAIELNKLKANNNENLQLIKSIDSLLEELIVRQELADNFCFYNKYYDNFDGLPNWGKIELDKHRIDKREYTYSSEEFENARTHDELWNAAQNQMKTTGKMHGYMRMYWAKKILEWSDSPENAIETAIYLNDKYELDGRDSNGYTGIAWSIGGLHDRPWFDKPVFGKVRYMNYNGCKKKFDTEKYIKANL